MLNACPFLHNLFSELMGSSRISPALVLVSLNSAQTLVHAGHPGELIQMQVSRASVELANGTHWGEPGTLHLWQVIQATLRQEVWQTAFTEAPEEDKGNWHPVGLAWFLSPPRTCSGNLNKLVDLSVAQSSSIIQELIHLPHRVARKGKWDDTFN